MTLSPAAAAAGAEEVVVVGVTATAPLFRAAAGEATGGVLACCAAGVGAVASAGVGAGAGAGAGAGFVTGAATGLAFATAGEPGAKRRSMSARIGSTRPSCAT